MPEYLAPGVYVEEVSYRAKSIEGVSTSTAGFVGPTRFGPVGDVPELVTSFAEFERVFGGLDRLDFGGTLQTNFTAQGVRAFFEEGGRRLYFTRVYTAPGAGDGKAKANNGGGTPSLELAARFPGRAGNMRVTFVPRLSDNLLVTDPVTSTVQVRRIQEHDTVIISTTGATPEHVMYDVVRSGSTLRFSRPGAAPADPPVVVEISALNATTQQVRMISVDVVIEKPIERPKRPTERFATAEVLEGFTLHPRSARSLSAYFQQSHTSRRLHLNVPFAITAVGTDTTLDHGVEVATRLLGSDVITALTNPSATQQDRQRVYQLDNGSDGNAPTADAFRSGLAMLESIDDISIVAAPGYSFNYVGANQGVVNTIQAHLINHAQIMRYRVAVLDSPNNFELSEVRDFRGKIDSTHAALYYPWVRVLDPITEEEISLPPSGFVSGIYARNDVENGVHKAPANEVVRMAIGFEKLLNKSQQDILNPLGINCFRFFEGRGYRLWGARTISSDPEWKYVNVRRYFCYLERSIDKGTQWVVFQNNNEALWANVRRTIEDFLFNEWKSGHLMGEKPQEAYFVRCDRSTMTQNDLDNGRLICLVGVAPVRPAEFVIFRIGQWTADRRS